MRPNGSELNNCARSEQFTTTHWSLVLAAGHEAPGRNEALEKLCQCYWYPLYAFIRRSGKSAHDAQDCTQGFFAFILARDFLNRATPQRGRFRSFLLASLKNFLADSHDRTSALKRGGANSILSLEGLDPETRYAAEPADLNSPERIFERRWAMMLLANAQKRLADEYRALGKAPLHQELSGFAAREGPGSYAEAAAKLSLPENTVKSHVHRMRRRYSELLREEIGRTVADPLEIDDEIRHLRAALHE